MFLMPHIRPLGQSGIALPFLILVILVAIVSIGIFINRDGFKNDAQEAAAAVRGSAENCESSTKRPCYDKKSGNKIALLSKGENAFTACIGNSAPNNYGDFYQKTSVCDQEKVTYCHDGASANFLRKFTGDCKTTPPPPPPPSPSPFPSSSPNPSASSSATLFKIVSPNGGESLAFGSEQTIKWEGGDTANNWPIYLSLVDATKNAVVREFIISTQNDAGEPWIVDLPLGTYYKIYGQGCRDGGCTSASEWDQSDNTFNVVSGSVPIGKINSSYAANQSLVAFTPTDGELLVNGSTKDLLWSGGMNNWNINISLVDNATWTTYTALFNNITNDGIENWIIPSYIPPGSYLLYISCNNCSSAPSGYTGGYYTYSFKPFNIKLP